MEYKLNNAFENPLIAADAHRLNDAGWRGVWSTDRQWSISTVLVRHAGLDDIAPEKISACTELPIESIPQGHEVTVWQEDVGDTQRTFVYFTGHKGEYFDFIMSSLIQLGEQAGTPEQPTPDDPGIQEAPARKLPRSLAALAIAGGLALSVGARTIRRRTA